MGEAGFGLIDGVVNTYSGWLGRSEVVVMRYDPKVVSYETLAKVSKEKRWADSAFPCNPTQRKTAARSYGTRLGRGDEKLVRRVQDTKYYASRTSLAKLPMTETQAARLNANRNADQIKRVLSPRQRDLLQVIRSNPDAGWPVALNRPFVASWNAAKALDKKLAPKK